MPFLKLHVPRGRSDAEKAMLLDTVHGAMVRSFKVPERDRYQTLNEYEPSSMRVEDTGLDIPRSEKLVLIEVLSRPRSREQKLAFYANVSNDLGEKCGVQAQDVVIAFAENGDEDWSFGLGRAQFLTGEL